MNIRHYLQESDGLDAAMRKRALGLSRKRAAKKSGSYDEDDDDDDDKKYALTDAENEMIELYFDFVREKNDLLNRFLAGHHLDGRKKEGRWDPIRAADGLRERYEARWRELALPPSALGRLQLLRTYMLARTEGPTSPRFLASLADMEEEKKRYYDLDVPRRSDDDDSTAIMTTTTTTTPVVYRELLRKLRVLARSAAASAGAAAQQSDNDDDDNNNGAGTPPLSQEKHQLLAGPRSSSCGCFFDIKRCKEHSRDASSSSSSSSPCGCFHVGSVVCCSQHYHEWRWRYRVSAVDKDFGRWATGAAFPAVPAVPAAGEGLADSAASAGG